jgi:threonine dehydrogenase-like Zn-dependent dehydrogenase
MMTVAEGAAICVSPDQSRVIVVGTGTTALIAVAGKKLVFRGSEIFADSLRKLVMFELKNDVSDTLQLAEFIINFHLNFNHLI